MKVAQIDNLSSNSKSKSKSLVNSYRKSKTYSIKKSTATVSIKQPEVKVSSVTTQSEHIALPTNTSSLPSLAKIEPTDSIKSNYSLAMIKNQMINLAPNFKIPKSKSSKSINFKLDKSLIRIGLFDWLKVLIWLSAYLGWLLLDVFSNSNHSIINLIASIDIQEFYLILTSTAIVLLWIIHFFDSLINRYETNLINSWHQSSIDPDSIFINYRQKLDIRLLGFLLCFLSLGFTGLFLFRPSSVINQAIISIVFTLQLLIITGYQISTNLWVDQARFGYHLGQLAKPTAATYQASILRSLIQFGQIGLLWLILITVNRYPQFSGIFGLTFIFITSLIISFATKTLDQLINFFLLTSYQYRPSKLTPPISWYRYFKSKLIIAVILSLGLIILSWIFDDRVVSILSKLQQLLTILLEKASS